MASCSTLATANALCISHMIEGMVFYGICIVGPKVKLRCMVGSLWEVE